MCVLNISRINDKFDLSGFIYDSIDAFDIPLYTICNNIIQKYNLYREFGIKYAFELYLAKIVVMFA